MTKKTCGRCLNVRTKKNPNNKLFPWVDASSWCSLGVWKKTTNANLLKEVVCDKFTRNPEVG